MSKKDLLEAKALLEKAQSAIPIIATITMSISMALPLAVLTHSSSGIGFGLLIGLSLGFGIAYVTRSITHAIIAILSHLSDDDATH